jgi:hypothetical protein
VSLAYSCTQSIRDGGTLVTTLDLGLLPYRGDWFLQIAVWQLSITCCAILIQLPGSRQTRS